MTRSRGRPRKFDEAQALQAAEQVFWEKGFSATSLDDLASAMDMNRPSIYRAFGDKENIYRQVLANFCKKMELAFDQTMQGDNDIKQRLEDFFWGALEVYQSGPQAKGCLVLSTAVTAATSHPEIRQDLLAMIHSLDEKLTEQFKLAHDSGILSSSVRPEDRAAVAQSLLHSLSLRARAGEEKSQLKKLIEGSIVLTTS